MVVLNLSIFVVIAIGQLFIYQSVGKLFTSLLNARLTSFLEFHQTLGEEQAGFRENYSTTDHVFTLSCLLDILLSQKKRLYCAFIDYSKAFDRVNRSFLWQKLLNIGVSGRILTLVQDLYFKAKSRVLVGNVVSSSFPCNAGLRQGENLSPLLYAIYLNDAADFISRKMQGLVSIEKYASDISMDETDINVLLRMFILLYADDTVLCAESAKDLQDGLDALSQYCQSWEITLNTDKTKVVVFSRGKIRNKPCITFNGIPIEVVFEFKYLGVVFGYNNSFSQAQKQLYDSASRAMFSLLRKCRNLVLPLEVKIELFDKMVAPILLYGSEVWCPKMNNLASKLQLRYYKMILNLRTSTPTCMVYGEIGQMPMEYYATLRMLTYWYKLVTCTNKNKFSCVMYRFLLKLQEKDVFHSTFLLKVEDTLKAIGQHSFWINQAHLRSSPAFKVLMKKCLRDKYIQDWYNEVNVKDVCYNYRMFKTSFGMERYLIVLPESLAKKMLHFRVLNHNLPVHSLRFTATPRHERLCTKCSLPQEILETSSITFSSVIILLYSVGTALNPIFIDTQML